MSCPPAPVPPFVPPVVVMGVSGCGKSTVGAALARALAVPFVEGDDLLPRACVIKMAAGVPLTDTDRRPWLAAVARRLATGGATGAAGAGGAGQGRGGPVVSCSALRREYRDLLRTAAPRAWFLHLVLDEEEATARVATRPGHFLPAALVASQFALLEPLTVDEQGLAVPAVDPVTALVTRVTGALARDAGGGYAGSGDLGSDDAGTGGGDGRGGRR